MADFELVAPFQPTGDQPEAIEALFEGLNLGYHRQTLLGVTGSGKTFTMANLIAKANRPALIFEPNKTLAAQLYSEFKAFFPNNAVEYFVSYYDYYQPEAYVASTDTYIEKDAQINETIEKLRHSATASLLERRDVIIIASVSCIYGLGSPEFYKNEVLNLRPGQEVERDDVLRKLIEIQYERNDVDFKRGTFRVRGDCVEVMPASSSECGIRIEFFGDEVDRIAEFDYLTGKIIGDRSHVAIYPNTHYVTDPEYLDTAIANIEQELEERLAEFKAEGKLLEAQRLEQRTRYDLEMLREVGYCSGVENLVEHGFRLPSALDNRPLHFEEFEEKVHQTIYVSATPGDYELQHSQQVVEQIIRPTGLLDPTIEIHPIAGQIDDLIDRVRGRIVRDERVLVMTLTKRMDFARSASRRI